MSGEGTTGSNIGMVDIDLEKDGDDKDKETKKHDNDTSDEKKEKAIAAATSTTAARPRNYADATRQAARLLPASLYATAMGRHVIDWSTSDEKSLILLEWPGVRFTFLVTGTTSIAVRLQTAGAAFGYRILEVQKNSSTNNNSETTATVVAVEEQVLGGGLFGRGMKDHVLVAGNNKDTTLNAKSVYQVELWKRNDPGTISRLHGLLVDGQHGTGIKPNRRTGQFPNINKNTTTTTTSAAATTWHLEFVGDDDTVGFGNLTRKSTPWYYGLCQMTCLPLFASLYQGTDVTKSWPACLCRALEQGDNKKNSTSAATATSSPFDKVHYSIIAWSGIGVKYSLGLPDNKKNMINVYPLLLPSDEMSVMKNHQNKNRSNKIDSNNNNKIGDDKKKNKKKMDTDDDDDDDTSLPQPSVHAVIVYLGRNDVASLKDSNTYSEAKLTSAWETLLKRIRHRRPLPIPIIVVIPTLDAAVTCAKSEHKRQACCELQNRLWTALVQEKLGGMEQGGFYLVENQHDPANIVLNDKKDYGMGLHWNADSHSKWAHGLEPKIRDILVQHPPPPVPVPPPPEQQQQVPEQRGGSVQPIKDKRDKNKEKSKSGRPRDCV